LNNATGFMWFGADSLLLTNAANSEYTARFTANGSSQLYYDNSKKFETTSTGVKTLGNLSFRGSADNEKIEFSASSSHLKFFDDVKAKFGTGVDLQIFHDGSNSYIKDAGTGSLIVLTSHFNVANVAGDEEIFKGYQNGAVELYYDNSRKLYTASWGVKVFGNIVIDDNSEIQIGTGSDLKIYHDGNNSRIQNSTGALYLDGGGGNITIRPVGSEQSITAYANSAVELYYDGSAKLSTTSGGITVTGSVTTQDINLSNLNAPTPNEVDSTRGSWTMQEGADDLFLINRSNGKKYKFNLTEVS